MSFVYLASPYTHADPFVQQQRFVLAAAAAGKLMAEGNCVYSPIAHGHTITKHHANLSGFDHHWWMAQCFGMLRKADAVFVLTIDGWLESKGLLMECAHARLTNKPIRLITNTGGEERAREQLFAVLDARRGLRRELPPVYEQAYSTVAAAGSSCNDSKYFAGAATRAAQSVFASN